MTKEQLQTANVLMVDIQQISVLIEDIENGRVKCTLSRTDTSSTPAIIEQYVEAQLGLILAECIRHKTFLEEQFAAL